MAIILTIPGGCTRKRTEPEPIPGTLAAVRHESSGGSMSWRSEFSMELTPREIVRCSFWPADVEQDRQERTHVPVTAEQWRDVERAVTELWPLWQEAKQSAPLPEGVQVLDGGDYSRWTFTWNTDGGEKTVEYAQPNDRRITTLITLLQELADPQGREIVWYEAPVLCGVVFRDEGKGISYQCTPWTGAEGGYRFIAYYTEGGEQRSLDLFSGEDVWQQTAAFCLPLELETFPRGGSSDKVTCSLYFSDGKQLCVKPDRAAAKALREGFAALTAQLASG